MNESSATRSWASAIIITEGKVPLIHRWHRKRGEYFVVPGGGIELGTIRGAALLPG